MSNEAAANGSRPFGVSIPALRDYGIYFALLVLIAFFSISVPEFRTWDNAILILLQVSVIGVIAVGMTFTIITAGIDLSVGSLLALAGILSGQFAQKDPTLLNMILAFAVPIGVGLIGGALNGAIIAGAGVNPLIVTLGTLTAYRGLVVWYLRQVFDVSNEIDDVNREARLQRMCERLGDRHCGRVSFHSSVAAPVSPCARRATAILARYNAPAVTTVHAVPLSIAGQEENVDRIVGL